jgi:hypothetical protein
MDLELLGVAITNLRHQGLRSYLTLLGVVIGIAAIFTLISIGDGLNAAVTQQFEQLGTLTIKSYTPAGAGGWKLKTKETLFYILRGRCSKTIHTRIFTAGWISIGVRNGICGICGALYLTPSVREYNTQDRYITEIVANNLQMLGRREENQDAEPVKQDKPAQEKPKGGAFDDFEDDIPFDQGGRP